MHLRNIVTLIAFCIMYLMIGANSAYSADCSKHPIFCQIIKNNKRLDKSYAMKLSNVIYKAVRAHHIPTRIFTAILAQESSYKLEARGCHKGLIEQEYKEVKVCSDFGIGQIYFKTANSYKFNIQKLTEDLEYSVNAAATVLAGFKKRYEARETDWWTRYNARSKTKRKIYRHMVERFL